MVGRLQHRASVSSFIASGDRLTLLSSPPMLCAANSLVILQISQPHVKQHARSRIPSNIRPTANIIVLINILIVVTNFLNVITLPPRSTFLRVAPSKPTREEHGTSHRKKCLGRRASAYLSGIQVPNLDDTPIILRSSAISRDGNEHMSASDAYT